MLFLESNPYNIWDFDLQIRIIRIFSRYEYSLKILINKLCIFKKTFIKMQFLESFHFVEKI